MTISTNEERLSILGLSNPAILQIPPGGIDEGDRATAIDLYRGLFDDGGEPPEIVTPDCVVALHGPIGEEIISAGISKIIEVSSFGDGSINGVLTINGPIGEEITGAGTSKITDILSFGGGSINDVLAIDSTLCC